MSEDASSAWGPELIGVVMVAQAVAFGKFSCFACW